MPSSVSMHRLAALPYQLHSIQARLASTASSSASSTNPYPYPVNPRPSPHQIFHLPHGASQQDIKARYYDLVRAHHPDSPRCRDLPALERHARFQAITSAYDILRGKIPEPSRFDPYTEELARRKRGYYAQQSRRPQYTYYGERQTWTASADGGWKDHVILIVGLVTLAAGLAPGLFILPFRMEKHHQAAVFNLSQARSEAREIGEERRSQLRKRVQEIQADRRDTPNAS